MNSIAWAMIIVALIICATVLTIYGYGDSVATCFVMGFFLFIMLGGGI